MLNKLNLCFFFLFSILSFSQNIVFKGVVNDSGGFSISYANVVLLNGENDTFKAGTTTNEQGAFEFGNIESGEYKLKISYLGFKEYEKVYLITESTDLGIIVLEEKTEELNGVVVVSKRPTVKRMVDRLVFNVENSTLSNNNVLDVLKHTPGVLVYDESISIKNSTPTIYINDRRVHLSENEIQQLLEGTSATNVKSIEVITNPPAKYEAEGGAVLNIITSKNVIAGYNGSIFGNYKQGSEFPKYAFGTSHFFKAKKLNTYLNYSISPRKDFRDNDEFINFIENDVITSSWETDFKRVRENANQNINANIDYELNKNNSIGFSTSILISPRENTETLVNSGTQVFSADKTLDSIFNTENRLRDETFNLAFTFDYLHKFKREGENLSVSLHHTDYDFSSFQNVDTDYLFPDLSLIRNNRFQTFSSQEIKLYTGQIDYVLPIGDSAQFETGGKISNINSESVLNQFVFIGDMREEDLQNSDTFLYDETNYAAYSSFSKDWDNWSFKSGLRVEYTGIKGNSLSINQINNNDYVKFFPSFYLLNRINDNNEVYFNYNKRIYRPRYSQLNPFRYFLNDNAFNIGDPNLQPQIDNTFTLGYTLNDKFTFEVYYRHENDPTDQIVFQDNEERVIKYVYTNTDQATEYGFDFATYTEITKDWSLYVLSSLFHNETQFFALESNNELSTNSQWSLYAQVINYFTFLKDKSLTADLSFLYISPTANDASDISARSNFDINFRKTLWNNRASVNIGVADIFNGKNFTQTTQYLNQDVKLKSRIENRLFVFGFNYKFGNFKLRNNKKEIDLIERERLN
ncbi:outer membrane beta-barrel family protein [Algibacter aquimarinus]|uniref:Outer membrane beta-barrel family protein n=1 Tax=Algibacter aquimarinus TaxID=1136748 RepID=A0ABP9HF21_9FLAO